MTEKCVCNIYRSKKKLGAYLYIPFGQALDGLPNELVVALGELTEVMSLVLEPSRKLANADVLVVMEELKTTGFYLQMPPIDTARSSLDSEVEDRLRGGSLHG